MTRQNFTSLEINLNIGKGIWILAFTISTCIHLGIFERLDVNESQKQTVQQTTIISLQQLQTESHTKSTLLNQSETVKVSKKSSLTQNQPSKINSIHSNDLLNTSQSIVFPKDTLKPKFQEKPGKKLHLLHKDTKLGRKREELYDAILNLEAHSNSLENKDLKDKAEIKISKKELKVNESPKKIQSVELLISKNQNIQDSSELKESELQNLKTIAHEKIRFAKERLKIAQERRKKAHLENELAKSKYQRKLADEKKEIEIMKAILKTAQIEQNKLLEKKRNIDELLKLAETNDKKDFANIGKTKRMQTQDLKFDKKDNLDKRFESKSPHLNPLKESKFKKIKNSENLLKESNGPENTKLNAKTDFKNKRINKNQTNRMSNEYFGVQTTYSKSSNEIKPEKIRKTEAPTQELINYPKNTQLYVAENVEAGQLEVSKMTILDDAFSTQSRYSESFQKIKSKINNEQTHLKNNFQPSEDLQLLGAENLKMDKTEIEQKVITEKALSTHSIPLKSSSIIKIPNIEKLEIPRNKFNKSSDSLGFNSLKSPKKFVTEKEGNLSKIAAIQSDQFDFTKKFEDVEIIDEVDGESGYEPNIKTKFTTSSVDTVRQEVQKRYLDVLVSHISQFKKYPKSAQLRGLEAVILVRFKISFLGELVSYKILKPSSHKILNKSVEALMQRAFPVAPIPTILRDNHTEFEYSLPIEFRLLAD